MMNPHHLELFYHVARAKGVSRAVRQMPYGIQQPSVSAQVNALERDLGVTLYERRPFKLTPAGQKLFEFVEPFYGGMAEARQRVQGGAQIRIGGSPLLFREHLLPVIESVRKRFPRLNLLMRALNQPELIEAVENSELDIVISLVPDTLGPALVAVPIVSLPLILLVSKRSKINIATDIWANGTATEPLIALGPRELICQRFQETLAKSGISWLPKLEMDSLDLIEKYVEAGCGVGLSIRVPGQRVSSKLRALTLPDFPSVTLAVIHRTEPNANSEICRAFLEAVQTEAARLKLSA